MQDLVPVLVVAIIFGTLAAIVIGPSWLKSKERQDMQTTLRSAIDKGQPLPPDVIDALSKDNLKPPATAQRDIRVGVIWLAIAIGITVFGRAVSFADGEPELFYVMGGIAAVPGFIGLAFIVLSFFNKNKG